MSGLLGSAGRRAFVSAVAVLLIASVLAPPGAARPAMVQDGSTARSEPAEPAAGSFLGECDQLRTMAERLADEAAGTALPAGLARQLATCDQLARSEPQDGGAAGPVALAPSAAGSGSISGTVTGPDGVGLAGITVYAYPAGPGYSGAATTATDGTYSITGLMPSTYRLELHDYGSRTYAAGYYSSGGLVGDYASATPVTVPPDATGIDVELPLGLRISGTVTGVGGSPVIGFSVFACPISGGMCGSAGTPGEATYAIGGLLPGSFVVRFYEWSGTYASGYYASGGLVLDAAVATPVLVPPDAGGIDVELPLGRVVSGTVTGPSGQGLSGVQASACPVTGDVCSSASSSIDGTYAIARLLPGTYRVWFYDPNWTHVSGYYSTGGLVANAASATPVTVPPDATAIDARMSLGSHISGTVTGPDGEGLEWISVDAIPVSGSTQGGSQTTLDTGWYTIGGLAAGSYLLRFSDRNGTYAGGYYSTGSLVSDPASATRLTVPPDATAIDVRLSLGSGISGTVSDPDGTGLAGIIVTANPTGSGTSRSATTAPDGSYSVTGLAPGTYRLSFWDRTGTYARSYLGTDGPTPDYSQAAVITAPPDATGVDITLPVGLRIGGTVTGPSGGGLSGISVMATPTSTGYSEGTVTGSDGTYSLGGLWPGSQRISVYDPKGTYRGGFYSTAGVVTLQSAATLVSVPPDATGIDMALALANRISGTVIGPSGSGLSGISILACGVDPMYVCETATSVAGGTYSVDGLTPGSYTVRFEDPAHIHASGYYSADGLVPDESDATLVDVPPDATGIDVTLPLGRQIEGTVRAASGVGLSGISVSACPSMTGACGFTETRAGGAFSLGGLNEGSYRVRFYDPAGTYQAGYYSTDGLVADSASATLVDVPPDATAIDVTLPMALSIAGRVTGPAGSGLAGIDVVACAEAPAGGCWRWARTAVDGTYTVTGLVDASYRLEFRDSSDTYASGYYSASGLTFELASATLVRVPPDATGIDVALPAGLHVRGSVRGPSGVGLPGIAVDVCPVGGSSCHRATSSATGIYSVGGLGPGEARVRFSDPAGDYLNGYYSTSGFVVAARDATPVIVPPDASGIDVRLPVAAHIAGRVSGPTGDGIAWAGVYACPATGGSCRYGHADAAGMYAMGGLTPGSYRIQFYDPDRVYASGYYSAAGFTSDPAAATLVTVPPDATGVNVTLPLGSTIRGSVVVSGGRLTDASVTACPTSGVGLCGYGWTGSTGRYVIAGLAPGSYRLEVVDTGGRYASGYYAATGFTPDPAAATPLVVPPDSVGIDVVLPAGFRIGGRVTGPHGDPAARLTVDACSVTGGWCRSAATLSDGTYTVIGLAEGGYQVSFHDPLDRYASGYYGDGGYTANPAAATTFSVGPDVTGVNAALPGARRISGTVTGPGGVTLSGIHVTACPTSVAEFCGSAVTGPDGTYTVGGLVRGWYELAFEDPTDTYADGFYNASGFSVDQSTRVRVYIADVTDVDAQTWLVGHPPTGYVLTTTNSGPPAGSSVIVSARLVDANSGGVPVAGIVVSWSATGAGGSLAVPTSKTNSDGVATVTFTTSVTAGTVHVVTATDAAGRTGSTSIVSTAPAPGPGPGPAPIGGVQGAVTVTGVDGVFRIDVATGTEVRLVDPFGSGSSITMTFASTASGSLVVKPVTTLPTGVPAPPGTTVAAFSVDREGGLATAAVGRVRITFLAPAGLADVALQRYTGSWTALPTTLVSVAGANATYEATSPGLSLFAVTGTRQATPIAAGIQAGTSHAGEFAATSVVVRKGAYVTVRFRLAPELAGKLIEIRAAVKRADGSWSTFATVTQRRVGSDGSVFYHARVRGWMGFRAAFAGDDTHAPGLSPSVRARGR